MFIRRQGAGELQARDYNRDENGQKSQTVSGTKSQTRDQTRDEIRKCLNRLKNWDGLARNCFIIEKVRNLN
jgi:hypothetical protein